MATYRFKKLGKVFKYQVNDGPSVIGTKVTQAVVENNQLILTIDIQRFVLNEGADEVYSNDNLLTGNLEETRDQLIIEVFDSNYSVESSYSFK